MCDGRCDESRHNRRVRPDGVQHGRRRCHQCHGHDDNSGCFRCHDKRHRTETRERIDKDCDACHTVLAEREAEPEVLELLDP